MHFYSSRKVNVLLLSIYCAFTSVKYVTTSSSVLSWVCQEGVSVRCVGGRSSRRQGTIVFTQKCLVCSSSLKAARPRKKCHYIDVINQFHYIQTKIQQNTVTVVHKRTNDVYPDVQTFRRSDMLTSI